MHTIIGAAEATGFFGTFPNIGEEVTDYFLIMGSILFFNQIAVSVGYSQLLLAEIYGM